MGSTRMRRDSHVGLEVPAPLGRSFGPKAGFLFVGRMTGASLALLPSTPRTSRFSSATHDQKLLHCMSAHVGSVRVQLPILITLPPPPKSLERARMRERLTGE